MLPLGRVCKQPMHSLTRICQNSKLTNPSAYGTSPNLGEEWSDGTGNDFVTREEREKYLLITLY